jgi:hypothetical protein
VDLGLPDFLCIYKKPLTARKQCTEKKENLPSENLKKRTSKSRAGVSKRQNVSVVLIKQGARFHPISRKPYQ